MHNDIATIELDTKSCPSENSMTDVPLATIINIKVSLGNKYIRM